MRDPKRIPRIIVKLEALWEKYPDWRLGQLIMNINPYGRNSDPFYAEDDAWEAAIDEERNRDRSTTTP